MNRNTLFIRGSCKLTSYTTTRMMNRSKISITNRYIYSRHNYNIKNEIQESIFSFMDGFTEGCIWGGIGILYYISTE
ncbi:hypothetical protein [Saudi moumouvirus]|uniref:Uncharacterized protein n=1 Tax=Moumouvirus sp. 'Monve' TaxID=1128131 RepID=H2EFH6_9VIRU|nr:hypothetical protein mv_R1039 [Moumouvirus Monve]AQN67951.1 hypothetical protein [Saudi moumouvirus]